MRASGRCPQSPIPCSHPPPLSLSLSRSLALHLQRAKLNMNIVHIYDIYYIFFVFWEAYAQLTKYFNLAGFCMRRKGLALHECVWEWEWMCVSICECVWVSESLSGRLEPVWSACSCTTERKEARRTEGERVYNRVEHRKLFILFLCFNLYLIPFLCSLFFRLPRFNMHFNQNVYVMYVKSRYQNVAILKKYIEIGAHTTKYK